MTTHVAEQPASIARVRGWTAVSMSAIAVTAFFALVTLPRATTPLVDGDVWWHLHAGEVVLASGHVPTTDSWSLAGNGLRWISQDWLSNTVMAMIANDLGAWGETGLSLLFGLLVVAGMALLWGAIGTRAPATGWLSRMTWLTFALLVAAPVLGVRVQTLDLVMLAAAMWALWRFVADRRRIGLVLLPVIAVAWVNLHAGFPLLFALGGTLVAGDAFDRLTGRRVVPPPLPWRDLGWLSAALVISAVALMLNPNGAAIYGYPFMTAGMQSLRDFIFEWSTPDLSSLPGQVLFALIVLGALPTLWFARREIRAADALWLIGAVLLSLSAIRFVLVAGPVIGALACVYLAPRIAASRIGQATAGVLRRLSRPAPTPGQAAANLALAALIGLVGAGVAAARVTPAAESSAIAEAMPVGATQWLAEHAPTARILNVYAWGGWLGRELPQARVYIDGRSDIYGDEIITEYARAIAVQVDPREILDRYAIDHVVFWPGSALASWLDASPDWRRVYADGQAVVWERATEA